MGARKQQRRREPGSEVPLLVRLREEVEAGPLQVDDVVATGNAEEIARGLGDLIVGAEAWAAVDALVAESAKPPNRKFQQRATSRITAALSESTRPLPALLEQRRVEQHRSLHDVARDVGINTDELGRLENGNLGVIDVEPSTTVKWIRAVAATVDESIAALKWSLRLIPLPGASYADADVGNARAVEYLSKVEALLAKGVASAPTNKGQGVRGTRGSRRNR